MPKSILEERDIYSEFTIATLEAGARLTGYAPTVIRGDEWVDLAAKYSAGQLTPPETERFLSLVLDVLGHHAAAFLEIQEAVRLFNKKMRGDTYGPN